MNLANSFRLDGREIPFQPGQTLMDAALVAGAYIPHLCHNPELAPHGSCRVCVVRVGGRLVSACTAPAAAGLEVESDTPDIQASRRNILQMLFVEGNHICPACEKTGACQLQAVAYYVGMLEPHFTHFFPRRDLDASHPDYVIDFNRCILCELCVRASRDLDGKHVFAISGRGIDSRLVIESPTGKLVTAPSPPRTGRPMSVRWGPSCLNTAPIASPSVSACTIVSPSARWGTWRPTKGGSSHE